MVASLSEGNDHPQHCPSSGPPELAEVGGHLLPVRTEEKESPTSAFPFLRLLRREGGPQGRMRGSAKV